MTSNHNPKFHTLIDYPCRVPAVEHLSWVIKCKAADNDAGQIADWLEGRLPRPVDDISQWNSDDG